MKKNEKPSSARTHRFLGRCLRFLGAFALAWANVSHTFAQTSGTAGNAITFDAHNSTMLFSDLQTSSTSHQTVSCYLRHNQAPIQIINANTASTSSAYASLETNAGTGTGFFSDGNMANNMEFAENDDQGVSFYNDAHDGYKAQCFAIIAPKGYRFTSYYMDIRSSAYNKSQAFPSNVGASNATIERYTYTTGSTTATTTCSGEKMTLSGSDSEVFQRALTNAGNILYFSINYGNTNQHCLHLNKLRLTYVIDSNPVEASIPTEGKSQYHSGYINLGSFSSRTDAGEYFFHKANVNDWETINIVDAANGMTYNIATNGMFEVPGGTYYIECPAKYRITGADINFAAGKSSVSYTNYTLSNMAVGTSIKCYIQSSSSIINCLTYDATNNKFVNVSNNRANATLWTITRTSQSLYTVYSEEDGIYLARSGSSLTALTTKTSNCEWQYTSNKALYGGGYYLYRSSSTGWILRSSTSASYFMKQTITTTSSEYDATIYDASGTSEAGTANLSEDNASATLSVTGFNNDAVKFSVSDAATFTAKLYMVPLDPYLQNLDFTYKVGTADADEVITAAATNFSFYNGDDIVFHYTDGASSHQAVFRNAYNENRSDWYTDTAEGSTLSNYFLVGSAYANNGTKTPVPGAKVDADQAGTNGDYQFSNIKTLTSNGGTLTETEFNAASASYADIALSPGDTKTVYIYSGDEPANKIITDAGLNKVTHAAYTFYDSKLKAVAVEETPVITVTPLYTSTIKGENNKNSAIKKDSGLDTNHKFYGVTVGSDGDGYLTIAAIKTAIEEAMASQEGIYANDVMRTILYVDMSRLKSVTGKPSSEDWRQLMFGTADNCLFFMPETYSNVQDNVIAGGERGRALGDILVKDQQPFYSPYNFNTGTRMAQYERLATNGQAVVPNTTLILPFSVPTNENGNAMTSVDEVNADKISFYSLNGFAANELKKNTYEINTLVATPTADANQPYHVVLGEDVVGKGTRINYILKVMGAQFLQTPSTTGDVHGKDGSPLTGHGSFSGMMKPKAQTPDGEDDFLYFSSNYFWKSSTYSGSIINCLPYRVYYTYDVTALDDNGIKNVDRFALPFVNYDDEVDAIELVNADGQLRLGASEGVLYVKSSADTELNIFDMSGRRIISDHLSAGNATQYSLSKGVYIANGTKVLVK
jgi:hypothetical protein